MAVSAAWLVLTVGALLSVTAPSVKAAAPYWFTGWANQYDRYFFTKCPSNNVLSGLYSVHHNGYGNPPPTYTYTYVPRSRLYAQPNI